MRKQFFAVTSIAVLAWCGTAMAETVTSLGGTPGTAAWSTLGSNANGTSSISTDKARSGDGSLKLTTTGSGGKAAATFGGNRFGGPNLGTLDDLLDGGSLGFEFYRDSSSTVAAHLAPALEITFSNGAALKWEAVYNGYPTASPISSNQWYTIDLNANTGLFWQFNGGVVMDGPSQAFKTLADWRTASVGNAFNSSTYITGVSIQAGSGWTGNFVGYADNVYLNLGAGNIVSANFETTAIPLPAAATSGMALLGLSALRRRRA